MTNSDGTTKLSPIAILVATRDAVYTRIDSGGFPVRSREDEYEYIDALNTVIANTPPQNSGDAAEQVAVARGVIERLWDDHPVTPADIAVANAALRSVDAVLNRPRAA
jgi:hypothetical protein